MEMLRNSLAPEELAKREAADLAEMDRPLAEDDGRNRQERRAAEAKDRIKARLLGLHTGISG